MMKKKKEDLLPGVGDPALVSGLNITFSSQDEVHFTLGRERYKAIRRLFSSGVAVYRNELLIGLCDTLPEVFDLIYFDGDEKQKDDLTGALRLLFQPKDGDAIGSTLEITVASQDEVHFMFRGNLYWVFPMLHSSWVFVHHQGIECKLCKTIGEVFDYIEFNGSDDEKRALTIVLDGFFEKKDEAKLLDTLQDLGWIDKYNNESAMSWDQYRDKYNVCLRKLIGDPVGTGELAAIGLAYNGFELEGAIDVFVSHCRLWHNDRIKTYDRVQELCKAVGLRMSASLVDSISELVGLYHKESVRSTEARVRLEADMLGYLQGVCMVIEGIGMAATHREKEARVRGALDVVNVMVRRLRDAQGGGYREGLFSGYLGSDYAFRDVLRENREMKAELARLRGEVVVDGDDHPF